MNRFFSLIPRYLLKNKKRTFLIGISIIISIALINSVYIMVNTLNDKLYKISLDAGGGNYHGTAMMFFNNVLNNKEVLESSGKYIKVGTENFSDKNAVIEVGGYERETYNLLNLKLLEGAYPNKKGEVALEKYVKDKVFPDKNLGDKITLNCEEIIYDVKTDVVIEIKVHNLELNLVGILSNSSNHKMDTTGMAAITVEQANEVAVEGDICTMYFRVKDEGNASKIIDNLMYENKHVQFRTNTNYLRVLMIANAMKSVGLFLIGIVIIGSLAVIYNIFYITVIERIREFSMLRAVGASKSQIVGIVLGEAMTLAIICIPIGITLGIFSIQGIYSIISKVNAYDVTLILNSKGIIVSALIGLITILIASLTPAIFGGRINPIEGMKENYISKTYIAPLEKSFADKIIEKLLDFTGSMAFINMKKAKKRVFATVISLTISITLFIATTYLLSLFDVEKQARKATGGDIYMSVSTFSGMRDNYAYNEEDIKTIKKIKGIKEVKSHRFNEISVSPDESKVTEGGKLYLGKLNFIKYSPELNKKLYEFPVPIYGCEPDEIEDMKKYIDKGDINRSYYNEGPKVIIMEDLGYTDYVNLEVGDELTMGMAYKNTENGPWEHDVDNIKGETIATLKAIPLRPVDSMRPIFGIMDNRDMEKYFGIKDYERININLEKGANIDEIKQQLIPIVNSKNGGRITTYIDEMKEGQTTTLIVRLILYGFSTILAVISLINIINTMSISVILRKREFGVLRAVGMSKQEITSIILKEGAIYGAVSSLIGCILGGGISYGIYKTLRIVFLDNELYRLPWKILLGVTLITIGITILVCIPAARRALKDSVVEATRVIE